VLSKALATVRVWQDVLPAMGTTPATSEFCALNAGRKTRGSYTGKRPRAGNFSFFGRNSGHTKKGIKGLKGRPIRLGSVAVRRSPSGFRLG
jgi:hypothetical protein